MGIFLVLVSFIVGYCLVLEFIRSKSPIMTIAGSILMGTILSGTILYLLDIIFVYTMKNYYISNIVYMVLAISYILLSIKRMNLLNRFWSDITGLFKDRITFISIFIFIVFSFWLNFHTFSASGSEIKDIGAWSDSLYHHSYIRSVSIGQNIPVQYPYFANSSIHWHFMFNYFCGKISQFGLNSVYALNIMSAIGMVLLLMLIYEFGRKYFKNKAVGIIGASLLIFNSSFSAFKWLSDNYQLGIIEKLVTRRGWIQGVPFEDWGLLNLSVFQAQKHFAFFLAYMVYIAIFIVIYREKCINSYETNRSLNLKRIIFLGIMTGIQPFWNLITTYVCIIFFFSFAVINYKNRKFMIEMFLSGLLSFYIALPQLIAFKSGDTVLSKYPAIHFGYGSPDTSLLGIVWYYFNVFGVKFIVFLAAFFLIKKIKKVDYLIFSIPFVLCNLLQFGSVLYDNNKLIFASIVITNCFVAYVVFWLYNKLTTYISKVPKPILLIIPALLILSMTFAGVLDFFAIRNQPKIVINDNSDLKNWIVANTKPESVFLTNTYIPYNNTPITDIGLAGRKLYVVKNAVDSSCDVYPRMDITKTIYSTTLSKTDLLNVLRKEKINYIVYDETIKKDFQTDEEYFRTNMEVQFTSENARVYSVR